MPFALKEARRYRAWVIVALAILFTVVVRVRLRDMALERDEGEYAYAGQLMLHGIPPYKEVYNMKLPGTYAAYAVIMAVFGQRPSGIHLGLALVNGTSIVLMFLLARRILDEAAGVAAAVAFAFMSLSPSVLGLAGHATHFVVLFALAGILVLLRACETKERGVDAASANGGKESQRLAGSSKGSEAGIGVSATPLRSGSGVNAALLLFISGVLFGLAFLMKQHGLFFGLFGAAYLLWRQIEPWLAARARAPKAPGDRRTPGRYRADRGRMAIKCGLFAGGFVLPYLVTCLLLWVAGALPQFFFWTVSYAGNYVTAVPVVSAADVFRGAVRSGAGPGLLFWILPALAGVFMWWEKRLDWNRRFFIVAFFFASLASIIPGFYFREHYFITLLPVLSLLIGVAVSRGLHLLRHDLTIELFLALPILGMYLVAMGAVLVENGSLWLGMSPADAGGNIYGTTLFNQAVKAADYVESHSAAGARIAVLGSEPEIYFYARRRSVTGYIYMYPLMEQHDFALKMQEQMIHEIEQAKPEYVVYVDDTYSWLRKAESPHRLEDWWNSYWGGHLDLIMTVDLEEDLERGADTGSKEPKTGGTPAHLLIFKQRGMQ